MEKIYNGVLCLIFEGPKDNFCKKKIDKIDKKNSGIYGLHSKKIKKSFQHP